MFTTFNDDGSWTRTYSGKKCPSCNSKKTSMFCEDCGRETVEVPKKTYIHQHKSRGVYRIVLEGENDVSITIQKLFRSEDHASEASCGIFRFDDEEYSIRYGSFQLKELKLIERKVGHLQCKTCEEEGAEYFSPKDEYICENCETQNWKVVE